ncbi:MAG: VOC family protein [Spirochaetaceae bacterium]|nr:VOC family protein [Myxococcales bacterium]MCB9722461.1 VOC family protein [Spirochaetaceae bacterium]HPG25255.1 VOC family protein [Myxococcota bacterium]
MSLSLLSVMHVNVNCSDLDRSLRFYRDLVGLTPQTHTEPAPQDGEGFGLPGRVRWDAHLLHDDRGFGGPAIDLLEWKQPKPVGRPAPECNHLGFMRVCFAHRDLDALHARLVAAGVPTRSGPVSVPVVDGSPDVRFFCCADPDGTCVEFVEAPIDGTRLSHININCSDLDASSDWYQRVLGVTTVAPRAEPPPAPGAGFGFPGDCRYRADFLAVGGRADAYILDLLEWFEPAPVGRPLAEANHLGAFRMAFMVDDAKESCAELDRLGVPHSGPCWLEMGPDVPIEGGLNAVFFRDPDGTCLELIETPKLRGA